MRHRDLWPKIVPYENNKYPQELVDKLNLMIRDYGFCHDDEDSLRMGYGAMADHGVIVSQTKHKIGYEFLLNYEAILWISRNLKGACLRLLGSEKSKGRLRKNAYDNLEKLPTSSCMSNWSELEDAWIVLIRNEDAREREFYLYNLFIMDSTNEQWDNLLREYRNDMLCPPNFKYWVNIDIEGNEKFIAKTRFHGIREKATP